MEKLFTADVIKAAAASSLGVLSLMCLILGALALAFFSKDSTRARLYVFSLLALGAAGFGYAVVSQRPSSAPDPQPAQAPQAERAFIVGRWQVEQKIGGLEGGTFIDYFEDGSLTGHEDVFANGQGRRIERRGRWDFRKEGRDTFSLSVTFDGGESWQGRFRIQDRNRIHNLDQNYDAVRVPH